MQKTIDIALPKGQSRKVTGDVLVLDVGGKPFRFLVHDDTLTHLASGLRIADLRPIKTHHFKSYHRMTDRAAAELALDQLVARKGARKVAERLSAAMIIN